MTQHHASDIHDLYRRVPFALVDEGSCELLTKQLTMAGKLMMEDEKARRSITSPLLASNIRNAFSNLADCYQSASECKVSEEQLLALSVAVARLTRNILAGVDENKGSVISAEPEIRRLCMYLTTFFRIQEDHFLPLQRALYQLLSNLVAVADHSTTERTAGGLLEIWTTTNRGEDDLIPRALESHDLAWNMACVMLVLNAIRGTPNGVHRLAKYGSQIMLKIADKMTVWHDMESPEADRCFSIGCDIFNDIFEASAENEIYWRLRPMTSERITTSAQIILLKLLDGRIVTTTRSTDPNSPGPSTFTQTSKLLADLFMDLSEQIRTAVLKLQGTTAHSEEQVDSFGLPKNLEAGMLVSQGLTNLCLWETELLAKSDVENSQGKVLTNGVIMAERRQGKNDSVRPREGVIESATALLYSLDTLLPRLKPYRQPSASNATSPPAFNHPAPPPSPSPSPPHLNLPPKAMEKLQPFAHLKRDLIRLIGTLAHRNKDVQDRVRENGGVEMILSLCVVDDRSPYIREHALFAVRNLMAGNPENQAVINEMAPIGIVGEDGLLKEMPERMGLKK